VSLVRLSRSPIMTSSSSYSTKMSQELRCRRGGSTGGWMTGRREGDEVWKETGFIQGWVMY
jgi:hypothetical protein